MYNIANLLSALIVAGIIIAFIVICFYWEQSRSVSMIDRWAGENGLQLLSASRCFFKIGTPFWATNKNHTVYRITVQDTQDNVMSGYVLCGGFFLGLLSDRVEVKWDNEAVEKSKNENVEKPKNDFIKRENEW